MQSLLPRMFFAGCLQVAGQTSRSRTGKSARLAGKRAERELEKLLLSWGLNVSRVAMSGALKESCLVGDKRMYQGDLKLTVGGKTYDIESKRHANLKPYYERDLQYIEGFCYLLSEENLYKYLCGEVASFLTKPDKRLKKLHNFFNQDDSHIVAMKVNYKPWLFAVREDVWEELKGVIDN